MQAHLPMHEGDTDSACRVSIVIKALNEETHIAVAITSALDAVADIGGEVVLADSCSTDRTVALANRYPIRIVQLKNAAERSCGIGPQLGYQHSIGEYVYILDGDMQMLAGFLPAALAYLDAHPRVAGVGGRVKEMNISSLEYAARVERASVHMQAGPVDRLDMGGLYRRRAIEDVGYFSDRNLHSYEELDLAVRLRAKGWQLQRIGIDAVRHHGHVTPPYLLLRKRWKSGYICGLGEAVRAAGTGPRLGLIFECVRELSLYLAVWAWWFLLAAIASLPVHAAFEKLPASPVAGGTKIVAFLAILLLPVMAMAWKKKSLEKAVFSVVSWGVNALGLLRGFLQPRRSPMAVIESVVLRERI